MKRIAIIATIVLMSLGASARSIHYFTYSQAARTVNYLNTQNELMIYCGYDYEIETYVLVNEIWMERVNSSYYEIWIYGYDAYTGDEIYMPLDLQCVWLYSAGRMYNAAQYLRFRVDVRVPSLAWRIPPYNPYTRVVHRVGYKRTYHYEVHRHGWMPPAYTYGPGVPPPPMPYYYMRRPSTPPPMPTTRWTPGVNRPEVTAPNSPNYIGNTTTATNPSANSTSHTTSSSRNVTTPIPSRNSSATTTTPSRNVTTPTPSRSSNTTTTPSRTTTTTTPSRTTTTTTPSRSSNTTIPSRTTTTTTPSRNTTTTTPSRNNTITPTRSSNTTTNTTPSPSRSVSTPTRSNTTTTSSTSRNLSTAPSRNNSSSTTTTPSRKK